MTNLQPRQGHCAAAISLSPGITEVVIFGGADRFPAQLINVMADTTVLRFGECFAGGGGGGGGCSTNALRPKITMTEVLGRVFVEYHHVTMIRTIYTIIC